MKCENKFCIYWSKDTCILDNVTLDCMGLCSDCIQVNIEDHLLEKYRERLLEELERT